MQKKVATVSLKLQCDTLLKMSPLRILFSTLLMNSNSPSCG